MGQKGITPIVATILILLLLIAIFLIVWFFFRDIVTKGLTGIKGGGERVTERGKAQITIESVSQGKVYVRNVGTIELTDFTLYIDNRLVNSSSPPSLDLDERGIISITEDVEGGRHLVRVTTAEGAEDQVYKNFQFTYALIFPGPPTYSNDRDDADGSVINGTQVNVSTKWKDDVGLDTGTLRIIRTPPWGMSIVDEYTKDFAGASSGWFNFTIDTTNDAGSTICWKEIANDTDGYLNDSMPEHCFDVVSGFSLSNKSSYDGNLVATCCEWSESYSVSKVESQDCGSGTCSGTNSWRAGQRNIDTVADIYHNITFYFNVSDLEILGSEIHNLTISGGGCWAGRIFDEELDCDHSTSPEPAEASTNTTMRIAIYNGTRYETIGNHKIPADGEMIDGLYSDDYRAYQASKTSGFTDGYIQDGVIKIRYIIYNENKSETYPEFVGVYDFASLKIYY